MDRSNFNNVLKCGSPLRFLTQEEMETIHTSTLEILQEVGSDIQHKGAREMLKEAGCTVKGKRVFFPSGLVEWATRQAPSHIHVYDREGDLAMDLGGRNVYYGTGSDCPTILDVYTGEHRTFTKKDMEDGAKIIDALPQLDFLMCCGLMYDYPVTSYEHQFAAMVRNTTKPMVVTAANRESISNITKMAVAVKGGSKEELQKRPFFIMYNEPTSPLNHTFDAIDKIIYCAENQIPTNYSPCMMPGATGPITNAGALVQANAECLVGLVISQLTRPGAPMVFGGSMYNMDLKCMQPTYCSPEAQVNNIALAQIGRELYHVPTWGFTGCSGGKIFDAQAVNEGSQYVFSIGFSGTNLNHDVGFMNYGLTFSYELLVAMNETIGQMRRIFDGVVFDKDHLAMDVIKRVGPKGHYLMEEHTLEYNKEMWQPDLTDRADMDGWKAAGATTYEQRVKARTIDVIENYVTKALDPEVDAQIEKILEEADAAAAEA